MNVTTHKLLFTNLDGALKQMYISNPNLHQHSIRVARTAKILSQKLSQSEENINLINSAALLHDVGKLLLNQRDLEESQRPFFYGKKYINFHTIMGARLLEESGFPTVIVEAVLSHHEWFNGEGLPKGLKGEEIPLFSRIIYICEIFDALTDPNREKISNGIHKEAALERIKELSGIRFDPQIVKALLAIETK